MKFCFKLTNRPGATGSRVLPGRSCTVMAVFVFVVGAASISGCGENEVERAVVEHPWINPPREQDKDAVTLPDYVVHRVHADVLAEAIAELEIESYIQLSPGLASHYVQSDLRVPQEFRPFLVRALDGGSAEITVIQSLQGLWMKSVADPGVAPVMAPLVVLLDPTPEEIFVTVE